MIMPLCGMALEEVLWTLPAAIAYQFQLVWLQMQGREFVIDKSSPQLLERLKKARGATRG
jgi:hypothetical protein